MARLCSSLLALALTGCGFSVTAETGLPPDVDQPDAGPGDPPPVARACDASDSSLRLCVDFDDPTRATADGSGRHHLPSKDENLTVMPRGPEQAALMSASSRLAFPEHPDFDIPKKLTVSLWMQANKPDAVEWLLDNNTQYAVSYQPDGQLRCGLGLSTVDSQLSVLDRGWHHVACTYDGEVLKVYLDGELQGCADVDREIATTGQDGLAIGANLGAGATFTDPYVGGLDNVQVFARTWSGDELCAANGRTGCTSDCDDL